jgi:ribonuclease VapC
MVIDTSAVIAVIAKEAEAKEFADSIRAVKEPRISAASVLEAFLVLTKYKLALHLLNEFVSQSGIEIIPVTAEIAAIAQRACTPYGRGTRANLNFGDLFSYATAKALDMPLLFKGNDFVHTDVRRLALRM